MELTGSSCANRGNKSSRRSEFLNAIVAGIRYIDIARRIDRDARRSIQLSIAEPLVPNVKTTLPDELNSCTRLFAVSTT